MQPPEAVFEEFQADYKCWDLKYFPLVMGAINSGQTASEVRLQAEGAKREMLRKWFEPSALAKVTDLRGNEDPPAFDPERDEVIVESRSETKVVLLHRQTGGLLTETRVHMVSQNGRWWISKFELKNFRSGKWSSCEV